MRPFKRELEKSLIRASRDFGAVVVSGPRQAGKTFLLRHCFPRANYYLLEDPDVLVRIKEDPRGWLDEVRTPAIIDEIQNAPELFSYIRTKIDMEPRRKGRWLLTGSREFALMEGVVESMAGRAAVFQLLPLSFTEIGKWDLLRGGFPAVWKRPGSASIWFSSYIQTYLDRDIRGLGVVKDLPAFRRFLSLLASRNGQLLNRSDLAAPLGVSVPTISHWLSVLETAGLILIVPPYFENFGKRLVKSPKIYWVDTGLACFLLGISSRSQLDVSPFIGTLFEGFVASEIVKRQVHAGRPREIYHFRDEQGLEVDFVVPGKAGAIELVETKWSKTVLPSMAGPMRRLAQNIRSRKVTSIVVHRVSPTAPPMESIAPGVKAMGVENYLKS